jgi:hypothetical protein
MSFTSPLRENMMTPDAGPYWNSGDSYEDFTGSKISPHIINVNIEYPKCKREFDVEHIQNIKHEQYIRTGFHIRRSSAVQERDLWEARIYTASPSLQDHSILIKGPSRDYWLTKPNLYHRNRKWESTKNAHVASLLDISGGEEHRFTYWLLVSPETIVLDRPCAN